MPRAHDARRLRICGCCGGFEFKELMVPINDGLWHVACVLDEGLDPELIPTKVLGLTPFYVLKERGKLDWALARIGGT